MTKRDLCDSLKTLFTDKLGTINTEISSSEGARYDKPVSISASCNLDSNVETSPYASLSIRSVGNDRNPNEIVQPRDVETVVDGKTVWYFDERTIDTLPRADVKIVTIVDGWLGEMRIYPGVIPTAKGLLDFDESDREVVSRFLIDSLEKAAETNAK